MIIILGLFGSINLFYIRAGGDGTLFWNAGTAYLFLNLGSVGYRMSYLQFLPEVVRETFQGVREPSDQRFSEVVFVITPGYISHYTTDGMQAGDYNTSNGNVYTRDLTTGDLWKWSVNQFQQATAQDRVNLMKTLTKTPPTPGRDYDDIDGWHKRCCFFSRKNGYNYVINLNGQTLSLVARREMLADLSIELVRPDGTKQTIWQLVGHPRKVSRSEYQQVFAKN